jgi:hypothetical protein
MGGAEVDWTSIARAIGQTGVVALGAIWLFLKAFDRWGVSRDTERTEAAAERKQEREKFLAQLERQDVRSQEVTQDALEAIVKLVELAQTMVGQCQAGVPVTERVSPAAVAKAAGAAKRRRSGNQN